MNLALSRNKIFAGISLIGNYTKAAFMVNNAAVNELNRIRAE